jgi:hypothetical protein
MQALDCKPSAYHGFPKGNNFGIPSSLRSKNNSKHGHPEACFACMKREKKALDCNPLPDFFFSNVVFVSRGEGNDGHPEDDNHASAERLIITLRMTIVTFAPPDYLFRRVTILVSLLWTSMHALLIL